MKTILCYTKNRKKLLLLMLGKYVVCHWQTILAKTDSNNVTVHIEKRLFVDCCCISTPSHSPTPPAGTGWWWLAA